MFKKNMQPKNGVLYKVDPDQDIQKNALQTFRKSGSYIKVHRMRVV